MATLTQVDKATRDIDLKDMVAARISPAEDITGDYYAKSNLIRVVAKSDSTIRKANFGANEGMFLPEGTTEYFSTVLGEHLIITGSLNIASIV